MMPATDSFWDILSQDEADFVQAIMLELANQPWAKPIVAGINDNGGLALHRAGITPRYEIPGEASRAGHGRWSCYGSAKRRR